MTKIKVKVGDMVANDNVSFNNLNQPIATPRIGWVIRKYDSTDDGRWVIEWNDGTKGISHTYVVDDMKRQYKWYHVEGRKK